MERRMLAEILERKEREVEDLKEIPLEDIPNTSKRSLKKSLLEKNGAVIAEIKRKSPSKGFIAEIADPIALAKKYAEAGAISILTDADFAGDVFDLAQVAEMENRPPILRKDFIIDPVQLRESVLIGADAVLLIAGVLGDRLEEMLRFTKELGLEALVEVHDEKELQMALRAGAEIIGINHRNLKTFEMDMELGKKLLPLIPKGVVKVAESGIKDPKEFFSMGFDAVLVGETLVKCPDPAGWIRRAQCS
jgi:indole-3-glycerol phosphate synthase